MPSRQRRHAMRRFLSIYAEGNRSMREGTEIFEDHKSGILALLRMELHGKDIVLLHRSRDGLTVLAGRSHSIALTRINFKREAMDEIERGMLLQSGEDTRRTDEVDIVPSHVRHLACGILRLDFFYRSFDPAKSFMLTMLKSFLCQKLKTEADPEVRLLLFDDFFMENGEQPRFSQSIHSFRECANAGENDARGPANDCGIGGNFYIRTDCRAGIRDGFQVPCSIINERDHAPIVQKTPFDTRRCVMLSSPSPFDGAQDRLREGVSKHVGGATPAFAEASAGRGGGQAFLQLFPPPLLLP